MTTTIAPSPERGQADLPRATLRQRWLAGVAWAVAAAGLATAWNGGLTGLSGAAVAGLAVAFAASRRPAGTGDAKPAGEPREHGGRVGAEVMVAQVVPVWSRQMDITRDGATEGLANILNSFTEMSGALQTLTESLDGFSVAADSGAIDGALQQESKALALLLAPSERAFAQRDAALSELNRCGDALAELQNLAKEARGIARHTRLVAFNASIEANRGTNQNDAGAQAVAAEVRMLASRMSETGEKLERGVHSLSSTIRKLRLAGEVDDTTPEELRIEIDLRAREALRALLGSVGASVHGSADVQQASATLREQLDSAFVHFQFGDRVSQMLSIVSNDMSNFARWVAANPRATQTDAAEWLAALEGSYTMEEQRSHHHGNVHVTLSTGVEFF